MSTGLVVEPAALSAPQSTNATEDVSHSDAQHTLHLLPSCNRCRRVLLTCLRAQPYQRTLSWGCSIHSPQTSATRHPQSNVTTLSLLVFIASAKARWPRCWSPRHVCFFCLWKVTWMDGWMDGFSSALCSEVCYIVLAPVTYGTIT